MILTNCRLLPPVARNSSNNTEYDFSGNYEKPLVIGTLNSDEIVESSGIVASRCNRNVFWTHNDSGDKEFIFAINRKGEKLATYLVKNAENIDWEDIATIKTNGVCFLYLGDIGNNSLQKTELAIYRLKEPEVSQMTDSSQKNPLESDPSEVIRVAYPDSPHNAETLLVHPGTGDIYIVTKQNTSAAGVYRLASKNIGTGINKLEKIMDFMVPSIPNGYLTGGEISPDGRRVVLCDYVAGYEIELPTNNDNFDDIWKEQPTKFDLGERAQGEAICYGVDGQAMYATSENKNSPLIEVRRKRLK